MAETITRHHPSCPARDNALAECIGCQPQPVQPPGMGCGTGSDGLPCSPAYLCPECIERLLAELS